MTFNLLIQGLCKADRLDEAMEIYNVMVERGSSGNLVTYNILIGKYLMVGAIDKALEMWKRIFELGLVPNSITYSIMIDGFCKMRMLNVAKGIFCKMRLSGLGPTLVSKAGQLDEAKSLFHKMVDCGFTPNACVYDSLLKGLSSKGETGEIINLIHQMAHKGVHLDSELTSTILICLCNISEDLDVEKLLPQFSQEMSKGTSFSCNELLLKLQEYHPELLGAYHSFFKTETYCMLMCFSYHLLSFFSPFNMKSGRKTMLVLYDVVHKEIWYRLAMLLYRDMLMMLAAEDLFEDQETKRQIVMMHCYYKRYSGRKGSLSEHLSCLEEYLHPYYWLQKAWETFSCLQGDAETQVKLVLEFDPPPNQQ
ncbi:hypothetical protein Pint_30838 [Pistacia integerrima]|uniref:Uncharacterized protein n=1 Tax=Pistacia integerrima TaxID=434235 RepID=A0ACC0XNL4_9ROSI|nr:hypothetical protein Pint_30838 [Pistacia integerrima]